MWKFYHDEVLKEMNDDSVELHQRLANITAGLDKFAESYGHEESALNKFIDWFPCKWPEERVTVSYLRLLWKWKYRDHFNIFKLTLPPMPSETTLLAQACTPEAARLLLDSNADVNVVHLGTGRTCLMNWISPPIPRERLGPVQAFRTLIVLLNAKADVNKVDAEGFSALSLSWLQDCATRKPFVLECYPPLACFVFKPWYQEESAGATAQLAGLLVLAGADVDAANAAFKEKGMRPIPQFYIDRGVELAKKTLQLCAQEGEALQVPISQDATVKDREAVTSMREKLCTVEAELGDLRSAMQEMTQDKERLQTELWQMCEERSVRKKATRGKRSGQQMRAKLHAHQARQEGQELEQQASPEDFQVLDPSEDAANFEFPNTESNWS
eukprot:CAMPEP_0197664184 /NCGR_PEP_ID=MMETSP1338-20131121/58478_1 /TAXON_ID=43686 ORGANISM="Pelagodinium beii, Strain RCC1491" /NCGR_SAMPLE_ID=MMETSP1338 /ASSEMBLY_ACC=CAM_ASM_000754 /LENGTH=384 /DNA_ID=CAMNT_0043242767 /DNA_START=101 /DNA_END=1255 /DNA_ORIENTATION=-